MRITISFICTGFVAGLLLIAPAQAADDVDAINDLRSSLDKHQVAEAWALAETLNARHAGHYYFDVLYARAALAAGRASEAIFALERVRIERPDDQAAWLLLVRAHLQAGDRAHARRELDALLASAPPAAIPADAPALHAQLIAPAAARPVRGFVGFDVGYDSNVNSATDAFLIYGLGGDPVIGVMLLPQGRAQRDWFARLSAGVGGEIAVGPQTSLFADVSGYANLLHDWTEFATSLYQVRAGASWHSGPQRVALPLTHQDLSVGHSPYRTYDAAALEWTYAINPAQQLIVSASRGLYSYSDQPMRDARATTALLAWNTRLAERARLGVSVRYGNDDPRVGFNDVLSSSNAYQGRNYYALAFESSYALWPRHVPRFAVVVQGSRYADVDPVLNLARRDSFSYAVLGWDWRVRPGWTLRAEMNYSVNHSTIELYEFDRIQALLGVRHDFR